MLKSILGKRDRLLFHKKICDILLRVKVEIISYHYTLIYNSIELLITHHFEVMRGENLDNVASHSAIHAAPSNHLLFNLLWISHLIHTYSRSYDKLVIRHP